MRSANVSATNERSKQLLESSLKQNETKGNNEGKFEEDKQGRRDDMRGYIQTGFSKKMRRVKMEAIKKAGIGCKAGTRGLSL